MVRAVPPSLRGGGGGQSPPLLARTLHSASALQSGEAGATSETELAQWNYTVRNARKQGGKGERVGEPFLFFLKQPIWSWPFIGDSRSFGGRAPKPKLEGKSRGCHATLPRALSRGQARISPERPSMATPDALAGRTAPAPTTC